MHTINSQLVNDKKNTGKKLEELLETENKHLQKLNQLVLDSMHEEALSRPFTPYPFILLNLLLSCLAALQAPVIMMSQNRKEEKDRQRAQNDYLINLKAEIEIRNLHQKLDLLIVEQMQTLFDIQKTQVELMEDIKATLKNRNSSVKT